MNAALRIAHLEDVATIDRTGIAAADIESGTSYIGLEHIEAGGRILSAAPVENGDLASNKFVFTPKHVLYGKLRPYLAKIATPDFAGICSTDIVPILPGPDLDRSYLTHFLRQPSMVSYATSRSEGINLPRLSPKALARFEIPLPPLDEQRRIAAILDKADALRQKRKRAITLLDSLTQSIFLEMFGDPVVPGSWPSRTIDEVCRLVRGSSPRPQGDPKYFGGSVPRLMIADITRDGFWVTPRIDSLTIEGAKKSRPAPAGTVVMAVSGDVGLVSRLAVDACVHDGFVAFLDLDEAVLHPRFFMIVLHLMKALHARGTAGAIFQNTTTSDIKKMVVPCPPINLQAEFLSQMNLVDEIASSVANAISSTDSLFVSLQQRAFSGQL